MIALIACGENSQPARVKTPCLSMAKSTKYFYFKQSTRYLLQYYIASNLYSETAAAGRWSEKFVTYASLFLRLGFCFLKLLVGEFVPQSSIKYNIPSYECVSGSKAISN